jgi:hypothetical protein
MNATRINPTRFSRHLDHFVMLTVVLDLNIAVRIVDHSGMQRLESGTTFTGMSQES